ncbi:MAG: hypothetical protein LBM16_00135 [Clostridiales bacterium]|jgi:hypothetical protein|nr:hypothetical protein [Clostridiales bacterium]
MKKKLATVFIICAMVLSACSADKIAGMSEGGYFSDFTKGINYLVKKKEREQTYKETYIYAHNYEETPTFAPTPTAEPTPSPKPTQKPMPTRIPVTKPPAQTAVPTPAATVSE